MGEASEHQPLTVQPMQLQSPEPPSPPPRWPNRQFYRYISKSPVSLENVKNILTTFDFEDAHERISDSLLLKMEQWMGYSNLPFHDKHDRVHIICDKVHMILEKLLWSHRYHSLSYTCIDGKPRLVISPKKGVTPLPLPDWLSTPYILPEPAQDFIFRLESSTEICKNAKITGGHAILDSYSRMPDMS
ncbi:hypothetical protein BO78DRAFT_63810 [Aspergillus sclerotiicarbonarius CBS 121057]|uniref:Uncharacterized protein n=1 Tax=Aspergillus sclerotiicarbonarius (strain CBS 121057 / IBT 28362) TaxID=1448318 RepID=A0A319EVP6_ASPSB|nr:hypothetical protein BO78DRAFT_63810 [Aspergillus sclerotiicarbonarius CBS 121057]